MTRKYEVRIEHEDAETAAALGGYRRVHDEPYQAFEDVARNWGDRRVLGSGWPEASRCEAICAVMLRGHGWSRTNDGLRFTIEVIEGGERR